MKTALLIFCIALGIGIGHCATRIYYSESPTFCQTVTARHMMSAAKFSKQVANTLPEYAHATFESEARNGY